MPGIRRISADWTVVFLALTAVGLGAQSTSEVPSAVRYNGRVVEALGGEVLPGVDVTCTTASGAVHRAMNDDKGEYALISVRDDRRRVCVTRQVYILPANLP